MLALQALGEKLVELGDDQLRSLDLDERLFTAVTDARSIRSRGALRRQKQLIGKLMRDVDPEPIRRALEALGAQGRQQKRIFREAESWRDRLVADGDEALEAYFGRVGVRNATLAAELRALHAARTDKARREAKRRIFRAVYEDLANGVQSDAPSI